MNKKILLFCICFVFLQSCAVNVYNWKGIPDDEVIKRSGEQERIEQYKKYSIKELKGTSKGHSIGFSTYEEPKKVYDLYTYSPILLKYSPKSEIYFQKAVEWENIQEYTAYGYYALLYTWILTAGTNFLKNGIDFAIDENQTSIKSENLQQEFINLNVVIIVGVVVFVGLELFLGMKEVEQYENIKEDYNKNLLKEFKLKKSMLTDVKFFDENIGIDF